MGSSRNHSRKKRKVQAGSNQVPHKFAVDERVLCYEPDMKKARVLYDSKVLEVVERSDNKGKIRVEYKIHFFGWNSSWDRYVAEDCVLKDTDKNRDLQKELKAKADVLIQGHLKKKKGKKTLTDIVNKKSGKGTTVKSGENDDDSCNSSGSSDSSDQESSDDEEKKTVSRIILTDRVKAILEQDYHNIMTRNMLVRVPAEVSVICVFEGYVKYLGFRELRKVVEQYRTSNGVHPLASTTSNSANFSSSCAKNTTSGNKVNPNDLWVEDISKLYRKVSQAQEIVCGLKTIFDYMLYQMLLYDSENEQYRTHKRMTPKMPEINCNELIPPVPIPGAGSAGDLGDARKRHKKGDADASVPPANSRPNRNIPGSSKNLPGSSKNLPGSSKNLPGSSKNLPGSSKNLPGSSKNLPITSKNLPGSSKNLHVTSKNLNESPKNLPEPSKNLPEPSKNLPEPPNLTAPPNLPGSSNSLPGPSNSLPGPAKNLPGPSRNQPGPSRNLPGTAREQNQETISRLRRHTKSMTDDSSIKGHGSGQLQRGYHDFAVWTKSVSKYITELKSWQMLPEKIYAQQQPTPCMVYGLIHVLRFFVKLPEILNRMCIPRRKVRIIARHVNQMIEHIQAAYTFSMCRLYVSLPGRVYEEDQMRITPAVSEEDRNPKVKIRVDTEPNKFSTRNHRPFSLTKVRPQLAKVVEVPLAAEEHQLTVTYEASFEVVDLDEVEDDSYAEQETSIDSGTETSATASVAVEKVSTVVDKFAVELKKEQLSPALPLQTNAECTKKTDERTSAPLSPPVLPMARQVRKSAAHAALKTAHMLSSQQSITSRTLAASTIVTQESKEEHASSRKRNLQDDTSTSDSKRTTRTNITDSRPSDATSRKSCEEGSTKEQLNVSGSKCPSSRRGSSSPIRNSKDGTPRENDSKNIRPHRTSSTGSSTGQRGRSGEMYRKYSPHDKARIGAKQITSPRKSFSSIKDRSKSPHKGQKSTSPTSSTIRLRSRSDERQLRSKGAPIGTLSLPPPRRFLGPKSEGDKSPRRRESTGNKDSGAQIEQPRNLRASKK